MKYSFIIPSVDKYAELQRCIASIERAFDYSKNTNIEIVVVFKGEKGENKSVETKYKNLVKFYTQEGAGLSEARNIGIKMSNGECLIFIDDDATVKDNILDVLSDCIRSHHASAFCGRILDPRDNSYFAVCYEDNNEKELGWRDFQYFRGSTIILKRDVIEKVGLFDEQFGCGAKYYAAEDSDIFFRLKRLDENIIYIPGIVIYHPIMEQPSSSKVFSYCHGTGAMLTKQLHTDKARFYIYLNIYLLMLLKNFVRMQQGLLFPRKMAAKNSQFHYGPAFKGMIRGMMDYIHTLSASRRK